jgi:transcriptional regulator with XRE-family HTH domain
VLHTDHELTPEQRFGLLVRAARESRGWTQEALARRVRDVLLGGFDQSAVARIEAGKRLLRVNEAVVLARLLNIDLRAIERPELGLDSRQVADELAYLKGKLVAATERANEMQARLEVAHVHHSQAMADREAVAAKIAHLEQVLASRTGEEADGQ